MVAIGRLSGRSVVALLSDMNQPLGQAVGNALEVKEAIETLHNRGPADFREHCLVVASHMLLLGRKARDLIQARQMAETAIREGKAWERFRALVKAQGGDVQFIDHPDALPGAPVVQTVEAARAGWICQVHARLVGETSVILGAGRMKKGDPIDHGVGILVHCKVGDQVKKGQPLFTIYAKNEAGAAEARQRLLEALTWNSEKCQPLPLFYDVVS
jgi:pyrimidine-nucleoside phosphorylase